MRARTLEAFHSVPKRGAEIGGLLLGRVLRNEPLLARVTGFEEVRCEYRFGPSYVLSEEDLVPLDAALKRERPDPVIGFVRSYTGREMLLDEADRNLLNRYFSEEGLIFLLVQPKTSAVCVATFLFPDDGEIGWEPQYPSFEFNEARLTGQAPEPANQARAAAQAASPASPAKRSLVSRIFREADGGPGGPLQEPAGASALPASAPAASVGSILGLSGAGVQVVEDDSPTQAATPAERPLPSRIRGDEDAAFASQRPLEPPERESARPILEAPLAAAPLSGQATARVHVMPAPPSTQEQGELEPRPKRGFLLPLLGWILFCVAAAGVYELWTMARAPRWTPLGLNAQLASGAIHLGWNAGLNAVRDSVSGTLTIDDGGAEKQVALSPGQIRGGSYDYRPSTSEVLFRLQLSGTIQSAGDSLRVVSAPAAVPAAPKPAESHPAGATADRAIEREPAEQRPANVATLPEPLREIHPDIPPGIRARIHDRVVVPVEVKVTATGRVTSAAAHGNGDTLYHYLSERAARAAREWRFSPARTRNGRAVPASRTVYFVFRAPEG